MTRLFIDRKAVQGVRFLGEEDEEGTKLFRYVFGRRHLIVCRNRKLATYESQVVDAFVGIDRAQQGEAAEAFLGKKRRKVVIFTRIDEKSEYTLTDVLLDLLPEEAEPPAPPVPRTPKERYTVCQLEGCGKALTPKQQQKRQKFCSVAHANQDPKKRSTMSLWNAERWRTEWKANLTVPPTHSPSAKAKRSQARTRLNKEQWRIWKATLPVAPTHTPEANQSRRRTLLRHALGFTTS